MADMWARLAQDPNVATALGLVFFYIFYRVVVLNYRKQKKDYEDRLKIEKAEADERKKMRELEREMEGIEEEDEEAEEGAGEKNPYLQMAMQFMKSGARVRRASNKRLPEYLERGVDVKFTDVAGLGKIRLELEEIVKIFTHGDACMAPEDHPDDEDDENAPLEGERLPGPAPRLRTDRSDAAGRKKYRARLNVFVERALESLPMVQGEPDTTPFVSGKDKGFILSVLTIAG